MTTTLAVVLSALLILLAIFFGKLLLILDLIHNTLIDIKWEIGNR